MVSISGMVRLHRRYLSTELLIEPLCASDRLVDDVLASVFIHCLPIGSVSDLTYPDITNTLVAPISVSHVSQRWRSLALKTSQLWQGIKIDFNKPLDDTCLHAWMDRAGNRPLYVDLYLDKPNYADHHYQGKEYDGNISWVLSAILYNRVKHLGIQGLPLTPSCIASILTECSQIESLTIFDSMSHCVCFDDLCPSPASIELKSLRVLSTNVGLRSYCEDIIRLINAPCLVDLTVEMMSRTMVHNMLQLILQSTHLSKDSIVSFRLVYAWPPTSQQLQTLLHHFINIQRLVLVVGNECEARHHPPFLDAELFGRLDLDSQEPLAPCLSVLSVDSIASYPMIPEACEKALKFMKSRAGKGLQSVKMSLEYPYPDDVEEELEVLGKSIDVRSIQIW